MRRRRGVGAERNSRVAETDPGESESVPKDDPFDPNTPVPTTRIGAKVHRPAGPWTSTDHALLRHLHAVGFTACPQVVGDGFDDEGREVLTWVDGDLVHPRPWDRPEEALWTVGRLMRDLHTATASFIPPAGAIWMPWTLHEEGPGTIISHCNIAPWNIVNRGGSPVAFIGWEYAGRTKVLDEIAATGWYCAQLHDDDVAARVGLPSASVRAGWLRAFLEGYGLPRADRVGLVTRMIEFAVRDTAGFARDRDVTPESTDPEPMWLLSWQIRAAGWMLEHREMLENAMQR
jgi:hypothetical protein